MAQFFLSVAAAVLLGGILAVTEQAEPVQACHGNGVSRACLSYCDDYGCVSTNESLSYYYWYNYPMIECFGDEYDRGSYVHTLYERWYDNFRCTTVHIDGSQRWHSKVHRRI